MEPIFIYSESRPFLEALYEDLEREGYDFIRALPEINPEYVVVYPHRGQLRDTDPVNYPDYQLPQEYVDARDKCVELLAYYKQKRKRKGKKPFYEIPKELRMEGKFRIKLTEKQKDKMRDAKACVMDESVDNGVICCQAIVDTDTGDIHLNGAFIPKMKAWALSAILKDNDLNNMPSEAMSYDKFNHKN